MNIIYCLLQNHQVVFALEASTCLVFFSPQNENWSFTKEDMHIDDEVMKKSLETLIIREMKNKKKMS